MLARVFNVDMPARSPEGERRLWELATENLPFGRAGDYNQALMDLGATLCTPRKPACETCPLRELCQARELGLQETRPVKMPKPAIPHYIVTAAIIQDNGQFLITQRPANGLLGGLWEFPGGKLQSGEDLAECLRREILEELGLQIHVLGKVGTYRHAYTHFKVTLHAFKCRPEETSRPQALQVQNWRWVKPDELETYPMGKIDRQIASHLMEEHGC